MEPTSRLREAKRLATENLIEEVALELALQRGHENVTVEAICSGSGIARSTFFNYFPTRESAIFGREITVLADDEAFAVLDAAAPDVIGGVLAVGYLSLGADSVNPTVQRSRHDLFATQPTATKFIVEAVAALQGKLTDLTDRWLAAHPEHARLPPQRHAEEAILVVGAAATATLAMARDWLNAVDTVPLTAEAYQAAVEDLRTVLGPARPAPDK